jgi:predicted O-linked N-acetylglucosamine transferase (SPINDLY family)
MNRAEKRRRKRLAKKAAGPSAESPAQLFGRAVQFHQAGQFDEAGALYQRILDINPDLAEVHCNLVSVQNNLGDNAAAERSHRRAIALKPGYADAHGNLGNVLSDLGRLDEAIACYRQALTHNPEDANIHNGLGSALLKLDRHGEAIASFEAALALKPGFAEAHGNLGTILKKRGKLEEAVSRYQKALALRPDFAEVHSNMGNALTNLGRLDDAIASHEKALAIAHDNPRTVNNYLQTLLYLPGMGNLEIFNIYKRLTDNLQAGKTAPSPAPAPSPATDGRLRIGYLSSDFRNHPVGHNVAPLLFNHDHDQFEIFCYSETIKQDGLTTRFQGHADHWRSVIGLTDSQAANLIRDDHIHIMVYLGGHYDGNRPSIAVHRPAPVQVSMHAGSTTAVEKMDFWMTDQYLHPPRPHRRGRGTIDRRPVSPAEFLRLSLAGRYAAGLRRAGGRKWFRHLRLL